MRTTSNTHGQRAGAAWVRPEYLTQLGDDELIADLLDTFSTDTAARIQQMRAALGNANFTKIRAEAHSIKGGARQLGANAVADACQMLESDCTLREASLVAAQVNRVQELFEEVRVPMASYSSSRSSGPSLTPLVQEAAAIPPAGGARTSTVWQGGSMPAGPGPARSGLEPPVAVIFGEHSR